MNCVIVQQDVEIPWIDEKYRLSHEKGKQNKASEAMTSWPITHGYYGNAVDYINRIK